MYDITVVYNDFKTYCIKVEDDDVSDIVESIRMGKTYKNEGKNIGLVIPHGVARCVYFAKSAVDGAKVPAEYASPALDIEECSKSEEAVVAEEPQEVTS